MLHDRVERCVKCKLKNTSLEAVNTFKEKYAMLSVQTLMEQMREFSSQTEEGDICHILMYYTQGR